MLINNVVARKEYVGNDVATSFAYDFGILAYTELQVMVNGAVQPVDGVYTVTGVGNAAGGAVVFLVAPIAAASIVITRNQPRQQQSDYQANEEFPADRIENDLGKLAAIAQQFSEMFNRTLKIQQKSLLDPAEIPEPTVIDRFLRIATVNPMTLDWGTLATLAGAIGVPVALGNGGTGIAAANVDDLAKQLFLARWAAASVTPAGAVLTIPNPVTANKIHVQAGNFAAISTGGLADGTFLWLRYDIGSNVLTDGASFRLLGRANYTTVVNDISLFLLNGAIWHEILRYPRSSGYISNIPQRGYGLGCKLFNNLTDPTNDIDINAGEFASNDLLEIDRVLLRTTLNPLTKQLDAVWAAGTGAGGRISTHALADGTWHIFLFRRSGGLDDVCFSNTLTPTVPDGGTKKRRIGSFRRVGGAITLFWHLPREHMFLLQTPVLELDTTNPGTGMVTVTLASIPSGIDIEVIFNFLGIAGTAVFSVYIKSSAVADQAPSTTAAPLVNLSVHPVTTGMGSGQFRIPVQTNTFTYRCTASGAANIVRATSIGWVDHLDRFAELV